MLKFPILKKMVRKPTSKTKTEDQVEVESPKTPVTPDFIDDDDATSPTFASVEQEDTKVWSSSFTWNMQTTPSDFASTSNVWDEENKHSGQLDGITKKDEILDNKDDFEENVWTDVQIVAGMQNNQSLFTVPFTVPDSPTILKSPIENVSTISKDVESIPSQKKEEKREEENIRKDSNDVTNSENFDYVDLGKDDFPSKELSKEFDEFTNSDVKLELNNNEILYEHKEFDDFEQCENVRSEKAGKFVLNVDDDDDFGAFECGEENESNFGDFGEFGEFKSENTNGIDNYEKSSLDIVDDFGDFEKNENAPEKNAPEVTEEIVNNDDGGEGGGDDIVSQKDSILDLDQIMSIKNSANSVAGWISVLDQIYDLQVTDKTSDNEKYVSIEDLVYNSHVMMNTSLNWNSFIKLWSDQGGFIKFTWRGSQIHKSFLESVNSISAIKKADRLPGSDLFDDDNRLTSSSFPSTPNHPTHDDEKLDEKNSMETIFINTPVREVPKETIENNDNKQSKDSNRDSWITMSDISFLESFSSKPSSKKSQRKSETFLDDFLGIKTTSSTSPTSSTSSASSNSRIDSVIAKINRNSTNLSAKLGSLKSHVFGGSNNTLISVNENTSPSVKSPSVKSHVAVNLLDDSINETIITKKNELDENNSNSLNSTPEKSNMVSASSPDDLNQQSFFSTFKDQVLPESSSSNNNMVSSTKFDDDNDDLLNPEKMTKKNSLPPDFGETVSDNSDDKLEKQKQHDSWISSTDLSFLESFTNSNSNSSKPSSSNSRKSQQNSFFDFSEFDLNLSSNVQPQKTSNTFLQSMSPSVDNGNEIFTLTPSNDNSKVKQEKQENQPLENMFNSNSKQLYTSSTNDSSTSISSEFGEMVSANDTINQNLHDDWMSNKSTNQDDWMSNSGLSFLETLKTASNNGNNNYSNNNNNRQSKHIFGDLDEFILPLSNNNSNSKIKKTNNQIQQQIHELF